MAVQAAKNTPMPGLGASLPPGGVDLSPGGVSSPAIAATMSGTPEAALGIEPGDELADQLPVSIHVPRPRTTRGSDDWDDAFGRSADGQERDASTRDAPVAVLFRETAEAGPGSIPPSQAGAALNGAHWEAVKQWRAQRPSTATAGCFKSAAEATAAMPDVSFMLPREG